MPLTPEELALAMKYATKREAALRRMSYGRWFFLAFAVIYGGLGFASLQLAQQMEREMFGPLSGQVGHVTRSDMTRVMALANLRADFSLRWHMDALFAGILFAVFVATWCGQKEKLLLTKILRSYLETQQGEPGQPPPDRAPS